MITDKETETLGELLDGYGFSLPTIELKAILEAYEQSKWVKFDVDDELTWPSNQSPVICISERESVWPKILWFDHLGAFFTDEDERYRYSHVTHWQHLPEFKEIEE